MLAVDLVLFNCFVIQPPITEATAQAIGPTVGRPPPRWATAGSSSTTPTSSRPTSSTPWARPTSTSTTGLPSGQGYTALTDGDYFAATGAHYQEDLDPATLAGSTWDDLNVTTLLSLPSYFVTPVRPRRPDADGCPFPPHPASYNSAPGPGGRPRGPVTGGGQPTPGTSVGPSPWTRSPSRCSRAGRPTCGSAWSPPPVRCAGCRPSAATAVTDGGGHHSLTVSSLDPPRAAGGRRGAGRAGADPRWGPRPCRTAEAGEVALDGRMQDGVTAPHWIFTGTLGSFGVFRNSRARGWAWVARPGGRIRRRPAARSTAAAPREDGRPADHRAHHRAAQCWCAASRGAPGGGPPSSPSDRTVAEPAARRAPAPVLRRRASSRPWPCPDPGDYLVTFSYRPPRRLVGLVVSALAARGPAGVGAGRAGRRPPATAAPGSSSEAPSARGRVGHPG